MNKLYFYSIVREVFDHPDIGQYISYGIKVTSGNAGSILAVVSDVSVSEPRMAELVQKCDTLKLASCHLLDVVEDFLDE